MFCNIFHIVKQGRNAMKKIILLPKTDTVIICLPKEWVGIPVVCKLFPASVTSTATENTETNIKDTAQKNNNNNE
jgi:hypothetical protein